jgi:tetratricopeptide (TPR) repeat protein
MKSNKFIIIVTITILFIYSCVSKVEDQNSFKADSQLLSLPHEDAFFYYPEATIRIQRKVASDRFIPYEVSNYLKPKSEIEKLLEDHVIDMELFQTVPSALDIVASTVHDLQRGDTQKAIEKNKNILNNLERNRTKTLNEDYGVSPFREASLVLALAYLQEGDEEEAIPILEKLVIYSNNWSAIYIVLSDYYYYKRAYALALDVATRGIDLCTEKIAYLYILQAKAYRGVGNRISAKQTLNRANELFPNDSDVNLWKGIIDFDEKNFESACKYFNAAYDIDKKNPYIAHNYSYCLIQGKQYDLASSVLITAIANYPSQAHLYYLNGVLENLRMNYFAAQKSWQTYLSLIDESDTNYKTVLFKLSQMGSNDKPLFDEQYFPYPDLSN